MILRKMLRDMMLHKAQFISIFLMSVLGVFIFAGIGSEWYGMQTTAEDYYRSTNMADAWIYASNFSQEAMEAVDKVEGITGVERRLTIESTVDIPNNPIMTLHFVEEGKISTCHLLEGEEFRDDPEGIWVDGLFAEENGLMVGDGIRLMSNGLTSDKTIRGTVMNPEYVYAPGNNDIIPNHANYGFGYLSDKALPDMVSMVYNELLVTSDREVDMELEEDINNVLEGKYSVFLPRKNKESYVQLDSEIKEHKAMGSIFPIAFLAVAMLTILTTMVRLVNNQRTQIGILKAIGFSRRKILMHYISYGLWISLAGAVLGAIAGPMILPYLFYGPMQATFTLPEWKPDIPFSIILMVAATVTGCTLTTYLACMNNLKDTPAECLRPKAPRAMKHSTLDKQKVWNRLGFNTQWNLRDALRSKIRCTMAIVGVMGCSGLMVCAFGMQDSMDGFKDYSFGEINQFETKIVLEEDITSEQTNWILEEYDGEALMEGSVEVKSGSIKKSGGFIVSEQLTMIHYFDEFRNPIELPEDEISITYKMAERLKISIGDELFWHVYGDEGWNKAKVGAVYRAPMEQGIVIPRNVFEQFGNTFRPTSIITAETLSKDASDKSSGIKKAWAETELMESYDTLSEAMDLLIYVLILAASVLAIVVLYNLGVLSFTERQRELATLKVIGFKTRKIRSLLLTQNLWMTAVGAILGIPFGLWIINYIFRFMGDTFDFITVVNYTSYLYSIFGTFLISIMVNRLFSRRVKGIDMVSSLKGVE